MYCLVATDDFSRFSWVFFLATKDKTSEILKKFITGIEILIDLRVKVIRCDNGTEFKNRVMNQFCEIKGRKPALSFIRPFGCPVTILNIIDHLGKARVETVLDKDYILLPLWTQNLLFSYSSKDSPGDGFKPSREEERKDAKDPGNKDSEDNAVNENIVYGCVDDLNIHDLEEIGRFGDAEDDDSGTDMNSLDTNLQLPICYDDDNDEDRSDSLDDNIIFGLPSFSAITPNEPVLSTEEPDNSLSMGDEHLDTIPATESDEFIKSGVENLIPIPSESEGIPDHKCVVPFHDNSLPLDVSKDQIKDFSKSNEEFSSTDDDFFSIDNIDYVEASPPDSELVSSEVMETVIPEVDAFLAVEDEPTSSQFPKSYLDPEGGMLLFEAFLNDDHSSDFKTKSSSTSLNSLLEETHNFDNSLPEFTTFSKVLFDVEYEFDSSDDQSCFDEDVLEKIVSKPLSKEEIIPMESLRTHDSSLSISSKIDSLLDEFAGELTLLKSIAPGIDETDCDFEKDIRLIDKLLYDNSSPRPSEEFISVNSDAASESFSPSPILVKDSDSLMEEIDLLCTPNYPMSPGIKDKDYDSERDILILKDLPSNNTLSFAEKDDDPSSSEEDVLETIVSKPLYEEEIIPMESLRTHDSSLPISSKIDSLLEEFAGELTLLKSITPGIDETDCDFTEDIRLIEKLLYDNSSPRPPEEFVSANSEA
nr:putative ribonuclease H-like domain-containing protein [Tanacetum cinerariifolium]